MDTAKMMERLDISSITALSEKLNQRKKLLDITNQIHAAQNIKDILVEHKEGILALFNALLITIYVTDKPRNELYSLYLAGAHLKEIRLPITNRSIAGFVANAGRGVNIADAYDKEELKKIDKTLFFDEGWDKQSGYRTTQVLALPILHENALMGVIQIVNRKGGAGSRTTSRVCSRRSPRSWASPFTTSTASPRAARPASITSSTTIS